MDISILVLNRIYKIHTRMIMQVKSLVDNYFRGLIHQIQLLTRFLNPIQKIRQNKPFVENISYLILI